MKVLDLFPWVADAFEGVKEESGGVYVNASCPLKCHRQAVVRFWVWGDDHHLTFKCWAGCSKLEILRAVRASWKDCFQGGKVPDGVKSEIVARYAYRDEAGVMLYETVRLEPGRAGRDKDFRQRRPDRNGRNGWAWSLGDVRRVLYHLPEIIAAPAAPVLVVGGEKDCDTLRAIGVLATTNVCGERSEWLDSYSEALSGRPVIVIEDADAVGRRHANEVVGSLMDHGASSVRRTSLPGKDATAFVNQLRKQGVTDKKELRHWLGEALKGAKVWSAV